MSSVAAKPGKENAAKSKQIAVEGTDNSSMVNEYSSTKSNLQEQYVGNPNLKAQVTQDTTGKQQKDIGKDLSQQQSQAACIKCGKPGCLCGADLAKGAPMTTGTFVGGGGPISSRTNCSKCGTGNQCICSTTRTNESGGISMSRSSKDCSKCGVGNDCSCDKTLSGGIHRRSKDCAVCGIGQQCLCDLPTQPISSGTTSSSASGIKTTNLSEEGKLLGRAPDDRDVERVIASNPSGVGPSIDKTKAANLSVEHKEKSDKSSQKQQQSSSFY